MSKTKEELINAFKKANKQRKQRIIEKAGYETAEQYLAKLNQMKSKKVPNKPKKKEMLDYVVAFDTTGSMSSYIDNVKKHIEKIIPEMFSQDIDLKMKIIAFGDYCDMYNKDSFESAYQESEFTNNQNNLITFVKNAHNTNGGDSDEFYELVIKKIVEETPWREGSKKAVLFIADCNPHEVGYKIRFMTSPYYQVESNMIDWRIEAKKAKEKGISFDTLSIHGDRYQWYKELSEITGGIYMPFQSSSKMSEVFEASAYVRGSVNSKKVFKAKMTAAYSTGDSELIGTYKSLSTLLDE